MKKPTFRGLLTISAAILLLLFWPNVRIGRHDSRVIASTYSADHRLRTDVAEVPDPQTGGVTHTVTLTWTNPTDGQHAVASGNNIERSGVQGGPYAKIGSTTVPTLTFVDSNVTAGSTYYYVVTAVNGANESGPSNEVSATIPLDPTPLPPAGLQAVVN